MRNSTFYFTENRPSLKHEHFSEHLMFNGYVFDWWRPGKLISNTLQKNVIFFLIGYIYDTYDVFIILTLHVISTYKSRYRLDLA